MGRLGVMEYENKISYSRWQRMAESISTALAYAAGLSAFSSISQCLGSYHLKRATPENHDRHVCCIYHAYRRIAFYRA